MKVFCCYTPAHEVLLEDYFKPSLPGDFQLTAHPIPVAGRGDFFSPEFLECIRRKIDLVISSLEENATEVILWSDIDIVFLDTTAAALREEFNTSGKEMLFQRETPANAEVNTGFIVCRASPVTVDFFKRVRDNLLSRPDKNEQWIINELLLSDGNPSWEHLPNRYYARSQGWPPPADILIYHANYTVGQDGIGQKIRQFKELHLIRKCRLLAIVLFGIGKVAGKLRNKLR